MTKKRDYKQEHKTAKARGEAGSKGKSFNESPRGQRQIARRAMDKADTGSVTTVSPRRKGKDISHNKSLAKGGSNKDGYKLESPSANRSRNGHKPKAKK